MQIKPPSFVTVTGARYIEYPNTGHIPIVERADDFNRAVLAFLVVPLSE